MSEGDKTAYVKCVQDGRLLRTYDFLCPASGAGWTAPSDAHLINQAKTNLTSEGLAKPPYTGIKFEISFR